MRVSEAHCVAESRSQVCLQTPVMGSHMVSPAGFELHAC